MKAEQKGKLGGAHIAALVSDVEDAGILELGTKYSVSAIYMAPGQAGARLSDAAEQCYIDRIAAFKPRLIVLAGFMRIIGPRFIKAFEGRVLNLHPSLLPSFKGAHGIKDAFEAGVKLTGCTVHWVTPALDAGPIIEQKSVRIDPSDTLALLEKKIHVAEHQLLPNVVARMSQGDIPLPCVK